MSADCARNQQYINPTGPAVVIEFKESAAGVPLICLAM